jgi:hypothetical protein
MLSPARRRRRIDVRLLVASLLIAAGVVAVIIGISSSVTGRQRQGLPAAIESVSPPNLSEAVPAQTSIVVDLASGYTGELFVDGVRIETVDLGDLGVLTPEPGQQVILPKATIFEPGNATLTFQPTEGAPVEELVQGAHRVTVRYWPLEKGPEAARTYGWSFSVF